MSTVRSFRVSLPWIRTIFLILTAQNVSRPFSLVKELQFYKEELQSNEKQLEGIKKDATKDRYDVQRFQDIVNESLRMVPDATKRLQVAIEDLSLFLSTYSAALDTKGSWYETAQQILASNDVPRNAALTGGFEATDTSELKEGEAF